MVLEARLGGCACRADKLGRMDIRRQYKSRASQQEVAILDVPGAIAVEGGSRAEIGDSSITVERKAQSRCKMAWALP